MPTPQDILWSSEYFLASETLIALPHKQFMETLKKKRSKSLVTPYETSSFHKEIEQAIGNPEIVARIFKIITHHKEIVYEFKNKYRKDDVNFA